MASPTHNGISCAWRIKGIRKKIEIGTQIEVGHKILAKWNWKLYCTVIAVNVFSPGAAYRPGGPGGPEEPEWFRLLEQFAKDALCSMVTQAVEHYGHLSPSAIEDVVTKFQGSVDAKQVCEIHGYFYGQGSPGPIGDPDISCMCANLL